MTRGIFHNTWGGSQWPFHLQIPPGALNMTTNCGEPGLTLDFVTQILLGYSWHASPQKSICTLHDFYLKKKKIRQPHYFPSYLKTRGDELIQPLSAHPSFTFSQTFAGPWPPMLTGQQQFQYLPWVLSLHTHTRVSAPAAPACWVSFFLKLRFMQSSGTQNECRVNLSRHQSGWKKRSFRRYCYFF